MTKKTTKTTAAAQPPATKQPTRVESLHAMLSRAGGASINEIAGAFGWARHSCRGLISTSRSKLNWNVATSKIEGRGVVYSIAAAARPQAETKTKASAKAKRAKRGARASA
jgi:hypothetical protein